MYEISIATPLLPNWYIAAILVPVFLWMICAVATDTSLFRDKPYKKRWFTIISIVLGLWFFGVAIAGSIHVSPRSDASKELSIETVTDITGVHVNGDAFSGHLGDSFVHGKVVRSGSTYTVPSEQ